MIIAWTAVVIGMQFAKEVGTFLISQKIAASSHCVKNP